MNYALLFIVPFALSAVIVLALIIEFDLPTPFDDEDH